MYPPLLIVVLFSFCPPLESAGVPLDGKEFVVTGPNCGPLLVPRS